MGKYRLIKDCQGSLSRMPDGKIFYTPFKKGDIIDAILSDNGDFVFTDENGELYDNMPVGAQYYRIPISCVELVNSSENKSKTSKTLLILGALALLAYSAYKFKIYEIEW